MFHDKLNRIDFANSDYRTLFPDSHIYENDSIYHGRFISCTVVQGELKSAGRFFMRVDALFIPNLYINFFLLTM